MNLFSFLHRFMHWKEFYRYIFWCMCQGRGLMGDARLKCVSIERAGQWVIKLQGRGTNSNQGGGAKHTVAHPFEFWGVQAPWFRHPCHVLQVAMRACPYWDLAIPFGRNVSTVFGPSSGSKNRTAAMQVQGKEKKGKRETLYD